jgi:hypothetical protein
MAWNPRVGMPALVVAALDSAPIRDFDTSFDTNCWLHPKDFIHLPCGGL